MDFKDPKGYGTLSVSVEGIPALNRYLLSAAAKSKLAVGQSMPIIGAMMEGNVKASISGIMGDPRSVDTEFFQSSVHFRPTQDSVTIADRTSYGKFLEKGTTRIRARNHFTNTLRRKMSDIYKIIQFNLQRASR